MKKPRGRVSEKPQPALDHLPLPLPRTYSNLAPCNPALSLRLSGTTIMQMVIKTQLLEIAILKKRYPRYRRYPYNNPHRKLKMLPSHQEALEIFSATVINLGLVSLAVQTCGNEEPIQFSISASGTLRGLMESTHKPVISDRDGHMCARPTFGNCIAASTAFMSLNCIA